MSPSLFTEHRSTCDLPLRPTGGLAVWLVGLLLAVSLPLFTDQSVTVLSPSLVISHGAAPIKSGWLFTSEGLLSFTADTYANWPRDIQNIIFAFTTMPLLNL